VGSVDPVSLGELATRHATDAFGSIGDDGGGDGADAGDDADDSVEVAVETKGDVLADPGRLKRLLQNLFRNAAEHGGDRVVVGDLSDGFYVADNGPGIPENRRDEGVRKRSRPPSREPGSGSPSSRIARRPTAGR